MSDISLALFTSPQNKNSFFIYFICCCMYSLKGFFLFLWEINSLRYVFYLNIHNNVYINDERSAPAGGRDDDNSAQRRKKIFTISLTCVFTHILCIHLFFIYFFTPPRVSPVDFKFLNVFSKYIKAIAFHYAHRFLR